MSVWLIPAYSPIRKKTQAIKKTVKTWPEGASHQLQDCFERNKVNIFEHCDLEKYTLTVLSYIRNCIKICWHCVQVHPNQKPWITKEVQTLLRDRSNTFRLSDGAQYSAARANLKRSIKEKQEAKAAHKGKIEDHFPSNNIQQVWQGRSASYEPVQQPQNTVDGDALLVD